MIGIANDRFPKQITPEFHFVTQLNIADLYKLQEATNYFALVYEDNLEQSMEFQGAYFRVIDLKMACDFWISCIEDNSQAVSIYLGGRK